MEEEEEKLCYDPVWLNVIYRALKMNQFKICSIV
jgi:hypothetical protein